MKKSSAVHRPCTGARRRRRTGCCQILERQAAHRLMSKVTLQMYIGGLRRVVRRISTIVRVTVYRSIIRSPTRSSVSSAIMRFKRSPAHTWFSSELISLCRFYECNKSRCTRQIPICVCMVHTRVQEYTGALVRSRWHYNVKVSRQ